MELVVDEKPLSPVEHDRLIELEVIIRDNLKAWYAVGMALIEIRDARLYRNDEGRTWEGYCREIFDMSYQHADRQIAAAKVVENLTPIGVTENGGFNWELLPANEAQARELARLEPEEQRQVWTKLIAVDDKPKITAKAVKGAVKELKGGKAKGLAEKLKDALKSRQAANPNRESETFRQAWVGMVEQIEDERDRNWKNTSREVAFKAIMRLADMVGECGNKPILYDRKITYKRRNLEKLLAAGWAVLRKAGELAIEQLSDDGSWLLYGEYETMEQRDDAFEDALLESTSIEA